MKTSNANNVGCLLAMICLGMTGLSNAQRVLPDPDGKPADMSKPVQVFILLGQSNMLGFGKIKGGEAPSNTR